MDYDDIMAKYGRDEKFRAWGHSMPEIHFPKNWGVVIIPPFGGAAARFRVRFGDADISVYADFDASLGCMDEPYWEIYPYDGDVFRCAIADVDDLLAAISKSIRQQNRAAKKRRSKQ